MESFNGVLPPFVVSDLNATTTAAEGKGDRPAILIYQWRHWAGDMPQSARRAEPRCEAEEKPAMWAT